MEKWGNKMPGMRQRTEPATTRISFGSMPPLRSSHPSPQLCDGEFAVYRYRDCLFCVNAPIRGHAWFEWTSVWGPCFGFPWDRVTMVSPFWPSFVGGPVRECLFRNPCTRARCVPVRDGRQRGDGSELVASGPPGFQTGRYRERPAQERRKNWCLSSCNRCEIQPED